MSIEPLQQGKAYSIDAEFETYGIEKENQEPIKGYILKVPQIKTCAIEIDSEYLYFPFKHLVGIKYRRQLTALTKTIENTTEVEYISICDKPKRARGRPKTCKLSDEGTQ